jgi:hypothetical protein
MVLPQTAQTTAFGFLKNIDTCLESRLEQSADFSTATGCFVSQSRERHVRPDAKSELPNARLQPLRLMIAPAAVGCKRLDAHSALPCAPTYYRYA